MRRGALSVCVLVLFFVGAVPEAAARGLTGSIAASTARESALVAAVNSVRTLHLLPKLRVDPRLTRAARFHSRDMLLRDYFAHGDLLARMARFHVRGHLSRRTSPTRAASCRRGRRSRTGSRARNTARSCSTRPYAESA